jgi:uncharacterized membrane protein (DUF4010 family)
MSPTDLFLRFGAALGIGFLIGLQREFAHGREGREITAGERTFALISLSGCLGAMIADESGSPVIMAVVILVFAAIVVASYIVESYQRGQIGTTTEVAILVAVMIGALCYWGYLTLAVALGIATTVLLSLKLETDRFVRALTREDIFAALQFAVISAIVLPILPNRSLLPPPLDVLNPFKIWLMVVFISGISFLGYVLIKVVGAEEGIGLTGLLGGLVSSTAVTLSFTERSTREIHLAKTFALAIVIAWTTMFARVLVTVGVLSNALLRVVWIPIAAAGLAGLLYCVYLFLTQRTSEKGSMQFANPFNLGSAIKFGLLYALVLLIARSAQYYFGDTGLLLSSIISGMADVDAITLSVTELTNNGSLGLSTGARAIVFAAISNTVVKGGVTLVSGSPGLRKAVLPAILLILVTGVVVALII